MDATGLINILWRIYIQFVGDALNLYLRRDPVHLYIGKIAVEKKHRAECVCIAGRRHKDPVKRHRRAVEKSIRYLRLDVRAASEGRIQCAKGNIKFGNRHRIGDVPLRAREPR